MKYTTIPVVHDHLNKEIKIKFKKPSNTKSIEHDLFVLYGLFATDASLDLYKKAKILFTAMDYCNR